MTDVFLWFGISLLLIVLLVLLREDWLLRRHGTERATGEVIDHRTSWDDGSTFFLAKVRFKDASGGLVEFEDTFGRPHKSPPVGAQVPVIYAKGAPETARIRRIMLRPVIYTLLLYGLSTLLAKAFGLLHG